MTSFNLTEQGFALYAISQIFRKAYSSAKSVDGAYERVQEKICDMRRGIKTCRNEFLSAEAIIHVTSIKRKITWEEAKLRHYSKSKEEHEKTVRAIHNNDDLMNEARKFDHADHGGHKFVISNITGPRVEFLFIDARSIICDLTEMIKYKGFHKLYPKLVAEGRKLFIKAAEAENVSGIEMARVVSDRISETSLWDKRLVSQVVNHHSSSDITLLYTHLHTLPGNLRKAVRVIDKAHCQVSAQDISKVIQTVIEYFDELA